MITIVNSVFDAKGADAKAKVFGITLNGAEDVLIKDCSFASTGYSAVLNNCSGAVSIENCVFDCANNYNPIEGSQSVSNGNVVVKDCVFNGKPGNNFICAYQVKEGMELNVENCSFNPSVDNNIIRISNKTNASMKLKVKNCKYDFLPGDATQYTGFLLCQDYTNKSGVKQDFSKVSVELSDVYCNGVKVNADGAAVGSVFYVYEDGTGVITGQNDPVVVVK